MGRPSTGSGRASGQRRGLVRETLQRTVGEPQLRFDLDAGTGLAATALEGWLPDRELPAIEVAADRMQSEVLLAQPLVFERDVRPPVDPVEEIRARIRALAAVAPRQHAAVQRGP